MYSVVVFVCCHGDGLAPRFRVLVPLSTSRRKHFTVLSGRPGASERTNGSTKELNNVQYLRCVTVGGEIESRAGLPLQLTSSPLAS